VIHRNTIAPSYSDPSSHSFDIRSSASMGGTKDRFWLKLEREKSKSKAVLSAISGSLPCAAEKSKSFRSTMSARENLLRKEKADCPRTRGQGPEQGSRNQSCRAYETRFSSQARHSMPRSKTSFLPSSKHCCCRYRRRRHRRCGRCKVLISPVVW
jgi:hypothetical protein